MQWDGDMFTWLCINNNLRDKSPILTIMKDTFKDAKERQSIID